MMIEIPDTTVETFGLRVMRRSRVELEQYTHPAMRFGDGALVSMSGAEHYGYSSRKRSAPESNQQNWAEIYGIKVQEIGSGIVVYGACSSRRVHRI
jgi:hypothetical protein